MIEMFVTGVAFDVRTNVPLVILNDEDRKYTLPIWIGQAEAQAIARALEGMEMERPMTHDLMVDIIDALEAEIDSVEINSFEDTTFFASVILTDVNETTMSVDSRPSDAISLALRMEAPIFVSESILTNLIKDMQLSSSDDSRKDISKFDEEDFKAFKEFIKNVKASDFTLS